MRRIDFRGCESQTRAADLGSPRACMTWQSRFGTTNRKAHWGAPPEDFGGPPRLGMMNTRERQGEASG
jgi:hypothetical protein